MPLPKNPNGIPEDLRRFIESAERDGLTIPVPDLERGLPRPWEINGKPLSEIIIEERRSTSE